MKTCPIIILREMYKYLDALKSESHQKYMEMLEKLSEIK